MSVGAQPSSSTDYGSNVTSSSNALKKGRVGQNKDVPTSSSPSRSRQVANASLDHPTPGTLTKAQTEFNIKVGMKDPLPDILSEMALAPVASRIVHRRSNRITESNLREVHISAPKSPRKIPISGGVAEQGKDQIKEKEEEIQDECTDDDVATEDQDTEWHERSRRVIKTERLDSRYTSQLTVANIQIRPKISIFTITSYV